MYFKPEMQSLQNSEISMTWFIQQSLPRIQVPKFDGNPIKWVDFIVKFKELVHDRAYLGSNRKFIYLMQHIEEEAKRALKVFSTNKEGYILTLRGMKYVFGQRPQISQAHISKLAHEKPISNEDEKSILEYYYTTFDCIMDLKQLNCIYDLHSTDVLCQTIRRLLSKYHSSWVEYFFSLRRYKEPSLSDLDLWLSERILAAIEAYLPHKCDGKEKFQTEDNEKWVGKISFEKPQCILCKQ